MWIWTANKFAKFYAKRLNQSENLPKSFRGYFFLKHPVQENKKQIAMASCPTFLLWAVIVIIMLSETVFTF